jgi:hypothetical protein
MLDRRRQYFYGAKRDDVLQQIDKGELPLGLELLDSKGGKGPLPGRVQPIHPHDQQLLLVAPR